MNKIKVKRKMATDVVVVAGVGVMVSAVVAMVGVARVARAVRVAKEERAIRARSSTFLLT